MFRRISIASGIALVLSVSIVLGISAATSLRRDSTIFGRATPRIADSGDRNAVELGLKFRPLVNGWVTGIRFYKAARNTGTHVASLWTTGGRILASATFAGESRSGWQSVAFVRPVRVKRGTTYVAGYFAPTGHYAIRKHGLKSTITHGRLQAIRSRPRGNGVYTYSSHSTFPSSTYAAASFYVDVNFTQSTGTTSPPGTAGATPGATPGATSGSNSAAPTRTTASPTQSNMTPAALPIAVTTQPIDGGSNYYCANGFTNACNGGWDNPAFVPIIDDYAFYGNSASSFKSMGMNTSVRVTGGTNMPTLRAANIWAIAGDDPATSFGSETVGAHVEEPSTWSDITSQATTLGGLFGLSGRFIQASFTWSQTYYGTITGSACGSSGGQMSMQEIMSCTSGMPDGRHVDIATDDVYWFAGQNVSDAEQFYCGVTYSQPGGCTAAQTAEASHYGDMVDTMREWVNGNVPGAPGRAPVAPYIETDDGLVEGGQPIKPGEINWAVWDTFVHGARMIFYFGNTSDNGTGGNGQFGFSDQVQSGQTVSDATQATHTNTLVENLAPIINSPFADGFASTGNGGYTFPTPDQLLGTGSQLDIMAKYYSGSGFSNSSGTFAPGFYIFATPRGQETGTNIPVTFTIKGNYSGTVPYICACSPTQSTGTVSVSNHQFTDTFAKATDVHIYGPFPNQ